MSKALKTVATVAGVVALTLSIPGVGGALGLSAAATSKAVATQDLHKLARRMAERPNLTAEGLIRDATEVLKMEADEGRLGRLLLAYPCPEYGARLTFISNRDCMPVAKAYHPHDTGSFICSGNNADWAKDWMPILVEGDPTPDDVRRYIREQAKHPCDTEDGWNLMNIGGNIIEIEVSPLGVQSRILYNVDEPEAA